MPDNQSSRSYKDLLITFAPAAAVVIIGFWIAAQFVSPAPPKKITISTGGESGAYYHFAEQYRDELAQLDIELEIIKSSGSMDNITNLLQNQADVALVQSGTAQDETELVSLGSLYYEPVWIFIHKDVQASDLTYLNKRRIAIGPDGSGTQRVARQLLALNGVQQNATNLLTLSNDEAVNGLLEHRLDVAFFVASVNAPAIQTLLRDDRVYLLNLSRAEAYSRLLPFLSKISLPEGIIDMQRNIPKQTVNMLAAAANLVVHKDFHSALMVLLLQASKNVHSGNGLFSPAGTFPSADMPAFPVSDVAERFFKVGSPFLMRYLPFWAAIFIDRMIVLLIPLLALLFPLIKVMPPIYRWRVRSSIYRWYNELQEVDNETFNAPLNQEQTDRLSQELDRIEEEVNKVKTPLSYADQLYNLLLHIDLVRKKLVSSNN